MKTKKINFDQKSLVRIIGVPAIILLILFIIGQLSKQMEWDETDYVVAGGILITAMTLLELIYKTAGRYKAAAIFVIVFGVLLLWAELAVGLFGTQFAGD